MQIAIIFNISVHYTFRFYLLCFIICMWDSYNILAL